MMTSEEFFQKYPIKLNKQQLTAAQTVDGPVLLLAVPGSGKTTVLVCRLGYMLFVKGIAPSNILTLTYTTAATADMKARFAYIFGGTNAEKMTFRTINSICSTIITYYGHRIGKPPYDLCSDDKKLLAIISNIFQQTENSYPTESELQAVKTDISYMKNMMMTDDEIRQFSEESDIDLYTIFKKYNQALKGANLMDFDDQLVYALNILKHDPEVLAFYQNKYPYICVDEAQDTSKLQHVIIAMLARKTENLFMVGDEDQSIYGFRAAYPQALLDFEKNHPSAKVLLMEENYRSTNQIVEAADRFIQKNTLRHKKSMHPTRDTGSDIRTIEVRNRAAQYTYLSKVAQNCQSETAVLYRDNECALPLIDILEREGIPYQVKNAELNFFTHRSVKDVRNIIDFSKDLYNTELFLQIYYKLSSFLKKQAAEEICQLARERDIPVLDAAINFADIAPYIKTNLKALRTNLTNLKHDTASKAMFRILKTMGYEDYLDKHEMSDSKVLILKALATNSKTVYDLADRLDQLQAIIRDKSYDKDCKFILSTIHSSKGLEYENVYLMDIFDGLFPERVISNPKKADPSDLAIYEEERRLFYVAVTRAKDNLSMFRWQESSYFVSELMRGRVAPEKPKRDNAKVKESVKKSTAVMKSIYGVTAKPVNPSGSSYSAFTNQIGAGVIVEHDLFGEGVITEFVGEKVSIDFDGTEKTFYAQILYKLGQLHFRQN